MSHVARQVRGNKRTISRRDRRAIALLLAATILPAVSTAFGAPAPITSVPSKALTTTSTPKLSLAVAKPDLAISSITTNASCQIVVTVVNKGPGSVPDSVWTTKTPASSGVYLTIGGTGQGSTPIWNFDPAKNLQPSGGSATYVSGYTVKGSLMVQATVDQTAQVAESNEGNNSATATLTCGALSFSPGTIKLPGATVGSRTLTPTVTPADTGTGAEFPALTPGATTPTPASGSLLGAALPPPPQNVPPVPPKESRAIEMAELVVVSANFADAQQLSTQAQALGLSVKRRSNLGGLGFVVTVFRVPKDVAVGNALLQLRQTMPNAWADANHRYQLMGDDNHTFGQRLIGWQPTTSCGAGFRVGLIDTPLDTNHPQFRGRSIHARSFLPGGVNPAPADHGTAVAALLIGRDTGLIPSAQLYTANIFRSHDNMTDTTAEWVVMALNWMAESQVAIINLSLGGPRNLLVEAAVQRLLERGIAVVAAAGNSGADAPPVFPAAQPGVVAVTAVDANLKLYKNASHGDYVTFAAPGVDIWTAAPGKDGIYVSGTSYAAPFVTASLVSSRTNAKTGWEAVVRQLESKARDLGSKGKDPTFGWGLVQTAGCPSKPRH